MDSRSRSRTSGKKAKVQKLGRYYLLNRVAQGGFAEVYRAVLDAGEGIHRLVAVKSLHSEHGIESEFSRAFRSEIKVSLGLAHPNIVPTFDFGEENGRPYIVFEYIHGRSLRQVLTRMSERSRVLSVEHSAFIIEQSAAALHYAHTFRDPISRDPIEIIHRDVSPQNILISFEGIPKLIDFGIAKVMAVAERYSSSNERTRTGVIKGKPAYLSPEQIRGDTLDGRSDVFALGIVLWETLTGVRLFGGKEHSLAIQAIMDTSFRIEPPSNINPAVPPELDQVVLGALARSREDRFRNARELQNGLLKFLSKADGAKSRDQYHSEISDLLSEIFAEEIDSDQTELRRLNEQVQEIAASEGRRLEGRPREFSLEELSEIIKSPARSPSEETEGHSSKNSRSRDESTVKSTTTAAKPPERLGRTIVMLPLPDKIPDIALEGPANKGVMPESERPQSESTPGAREPVFEPGRGSWPTGKREPAIRDGQRELVIREATRARAEAPAKPPKTRPHLRIVPDPIEDGPTESMLRVPPFQPQPPQPLPTAPPLPPAYEPSLSQTLTANELRAPTAQPTPQKGPLVRALAIFFGLLFGLLILNRVFRSHTPTSNSDPFTTSTRPAAQPADPTQPDHEDDHTTVEPETAPEYKDYSVPPIDIVPGNSRVPGK